MSFPSIQMPSLVLPAYWVSGAENELVADLVEHTSVEFYLADIQEKVIHITAIESVAVGAPGNLWVWVELSPVPSTVSAAYWAAIGGGGGLLVPVAPLVIAGAGVDGTTHTEILWWQMPSQYARIVAQTPVNAGLPNDHWHLQVVFEGKGL